MDDKYCAKIERVFDINSRVTYYKDTITDEELVSCRGKFAIVDWDESQAPAGIDCLCEGVITNFLIDRTLTIDEDTHIQPWEWDTIDVFDLINQKGVNMKPELIHTT